MGGGRGGENLLTLIISKLLQYGINSSFYALPQHCEQKKIIGPHCKQQYKALSAVEAVQS